MIIGIDEAGRGALAGPVVAAAVAEIKDSKLKIKNSEAFNSIKDSKKLTDKQRRQAYSWLVANVTFGVGQVAAAQVDEIGIKAATEKAMNQALEALDKGLKRGGDEEIKLFVDGRDGFQFPYLSEDVVKGDEKILEISAASIIAKVTRDDYMIQAAKEFPQFGFADHKGYGAKAHYQLLDQGVYCAEHRQTYAPLKTWLTQGRLF